MPLVQPEYMHMHLDIMPEEILDKYHLFHLTNSDGWVYIEMVTGMYDLSKAGLLANKLLEQQLMSQGFYQCQFTPGLWRHVWRPITFVLLVDNFGVKHEGKQNAKYLINTLTNHYEISIDWDCKLFCGVSLNWDYTNRWVNLAMPEYIAKTVHFFQHAQP